MAIIVVGGHSRNVGKTSVVTGLISAFSRHPWTAIKISSHRHDGLNEADEIHEEKDRRGSSDTSRFLAAGASRSLWVRMGEDNADSILPRLMPIIQADPFVIIESNYILKFIRPDLCIMVLRCDVREFKDSARQTLRQAGAVVVLNPDSSPPAWKGLPNDALDDIPVFAAANPQNLPKGLIDLVQTRLTEA